MFNDNLNIFYKLKKTVLLLAGFEPTNFDLYCGIPSLGTELAGPNIN